MLHGSCHSSNSWWLRKPGSAVEPAPLPAAADIVIVGGGITGAALSRHLGRHRGAVILLERDHLGSGATGRNAGMILNSTASNYARAVEVFGRSRAREIWEFMAENHRLLKLAIANQGAGYRQLGSWTVPASLEEGRALEAAAGLLREDGLEGSWVARPPAPLDAYPGALLNTGDGEVDPVAMVRALATGEIFEGIAVIGIEASSAGVRVHTTVGEVQAGAVVLATNAYTSHLLPEVPIAPVRGQLLATAPVARVVAERPVYANWGYEYWRQLADGRLLLGGFRDRAASDEVGFEEVPTTIIQSHLDAQLRRLGVDAEVTHRWAGTMGFTVDGLPLVGSVPGRPNVFVCGGYTGHGLGFAFHATIRLAELLLNGTAVPGWLSAGRASWRGSHGGASNPSGMPRVLPIGRALNS